MTNELNNELEMLLEFFLEQRKNPPEIFTYAQGVIPNPSFFSVRSLQSHLNNPMLDPSWVHLILKGESLSLDPACLFKPVQNLKIGFIDKDFINDALAKGAAVLLEGIDILEPTINAFVARLDDALPCSLCTCGAFFSQPGNEAYPAHCDSDDVLAMQLSGEKTWQIFTPQQRRYAETDHLTQEQLGPVIHEVIMRPGDALYVPAGVPHLVKTTGDHSLHMSFDLIDSTPRVEQITQEANKLYEYSCEDAFAPASKVMQRYIKLIESQDFQGMLAAATQDLKNDAKQFRQRVGRSASVDALSQFFPD